MNVSSATQQSNDAFAQTYSVAVAKKQQDATQATGQAALQLIQGAASAAPKLQEGQSINVMA